MYSKIVKEVARRVFPQAMEEYRVTRATFPLRRIGETAYAMRISFHRKKREEEKKENIQDAGIYIWRSHIRAEELSPDLTSEVDLLVHIRYVLVPIGN